MPHVLQHEGYVLTDDPSRLDLDAIHAYLTRSYWSENIPRDTVARAVENSLCIGIYAANGAQVGLVRVITDSATFAYLCDVYVLEAHRQRGLAKAALRLLKTHPRLQGLRCWRLVTQDAHGLYQQFGFSVIKHAERHMEKRFIETYGKSSSVPGTRGAVGNASS